MNPRRPDRDDSNLDKNDAIVLTAGTLRAGESAPADLPPRHRGHPDDRLSIFWRVFGGTILSILALVAVTLYNNQTNTINDLRGDVNRLNEARVELVKKEEFNSRLQNVWDRLQTLQELRVTVTTLKEQLNGLSEKQADVRGLRDQLTSIDQRLKAAEDDHRVLNKAELAITALEQKIGARDSQLKAADEDRRELAKQLQDLRERLAKFEGATETRPATRSTSQKPPE